MSINRPHPVQKLKSGFTIVEMIIIAPIVILVIGTFISAVVNMTGEVLMTRGANALAYNIQDALNRIEADVKLSTTFLAKNSIELASPQGYDNSVSDFTNVGPNGNMLILNTLATTGNPLSTSSSLVYLTDKPNACASSAVNQNTPMTMNVIYFVKDNTLWRRTIAPENYLTAGCTTPWQQPSCNSTYVGLFCKTLDNRLVNNVDPEDFVLQYFNSASGTASDTTATDAGQTEAQRGVALQSDTTVVASLNIDKTIAGREINQKGAIRSTRLDVNASTIAPVIAAITPAAPTVTASIAPSVPTTANFTWASVQGAGSYTLDYRVDAWNPVTRTNSTGTWTNGFTNRIETNRSYSVTANHADKVYVRVTANSTDTQLASSQYGNANITIPLWGTFQMQSLWTNYGGAWATPAFTKTNAGIVMLKGMIRRSGTPVSGEVIATLPVGYRPAEIYMFQTSSADTTTRLDIYPDGNIKIITGYGSWFSLEGVSFVPAGSSYSWTAATLYNGWVNYGAGFATAGYTRDSVGRVFTKGLVASGTATPNIPIIAPPAGYRSSEYLHLPTTSNNVFDANGIESAATGGVTTKTLPYNSFRSIHHRYYASGYATWSNLTLQNSWAAYAGYAAPQYTKGSDGIVTVKGLIRNGVTASGTVIANLPVGFRPKEQILLSAACNMTYCRIDVYPDGNIIARAGVSAAWSALEGITFLSEQ